MHTIKYYLSVVILLSSTFIFAKTNDPVIIRIDKKTEIRKSDFEYAYHKTDSLSNQSLDSFLHPYVTFLLNIEEAKNQNLDKDISFLNEYSSYIDFLEKPYLSDTISPDIVTRNIHDRLKENIEVSHLFLKFPKIPILPEDTVNTYKQANYIKGIIDQKNAPSFDSLVSKYSQDSLTLNSREPGYIGWLTALSIPLSFENAIYNSPVGSITNPIRTDRGYHFFKVRGKRADPGQINISYIELAYPREFPTQNEKDSVAQLANKLYDELSNGADFAKLCQQYSSDRSTVGKGGNLGWFGVNRPLPESLESQLFAIEKAGTVVPPIESDYGFHIIKVIDKQPLVEWDQMKSDLEKAIEGSDRKSLITEAKINRLEKEYPYKVNEATYGKVQKIANTHLIADSTFREIVTPISDKTILNIGTSAFTVKDFTTYFERNPSTAYALSTDILANKFREFILESLIQTKRNNMLVENPDIRLLANEYRDGILYFNVMNKNVWDKSKSSKDQLQQVFVNNSSKYAWNTPKYKGYVIHAKDEKTLNEVKLLANSYDKKNDFRKVLLDNLDKETLKNVIIDKGLWAKGENQYVDNILYNTSITNEIINYPIFIIEGEKISAPESYEDVIGEVSADYQVILEKEWIDYLTNKYSVEINQDILKSVK